MITLVVHKKWHVQQMVVKFKDYSIVFLTAFFQIFFVVVQTVQLANMSALSYIELRIFVVSLCIGSMWLMNVGVGARDCKISKFIYMIGTSSGAVLGSKIESILSVII